MADADGNSYVTNCAGHAAAKGKRDRDAGMFEDQLVIERNEELDGELQKKIHAFKDEERVMEIYEFIIKHRPGTPVRTHTLIRGGYNAIFHLEYTDGSAALQPRDAKDRLSPAAGRDAFVVGSRPLTQEMNNIVVQGGVPPSVLPPEHKTYSTSDEWYEALADMHFAHLTFQHNDAIDSADDCRDKFVARHLFRQRVRQRKLAESSSSSPSSTITTTTTHPTRQKKTTPKIGKKKTFGLWIEGLQPHNILVDTDLNVVGVIDWEWAYFGSRTFGHDPPWWYVLFFVPPSG